LKNYIIDYATLFVISGLVIFLDQLSKTIVRLQLVIGEIWSPWAWLEPYARIVHWKNTGAAFGMLPSFSDVFRILAFIVAIAILYYYPQIPRNEWPLRLALGLQFGGAVGNLIDRVRVGWVTDFISLGNLPVFNIADLSIFVGTIILVIWVWISERKKEVHELSSEEEEVTEQSTDPLPEEPIGE
jgi:signal peptidase II